MRCAPVRNATATLKREAVALVTGYCYRGEIASKTEYAIQTEIRDSTRGECRIEGESDSWLLGLVQTINHKQYCYRRCGYTGPSLRCDVGKPGCGCVQGVFRGVLRGVASLQLKHAMPGTQYTVYTHTHPDPINRQPPIKGKEELYYSGHVQSIFRQANVITQTLSGTSLSSLALTLVPLDIAAPTSPGYTPDVQAPRTEHPGLRAGS